MTLDDETEGYTRPDGRRIGGVLVEMRIAGSAAEGRLGGLK